MVCIIPNNLIEDFFSAQVFGSNFTRGHASSDDRMRNSVDSGSSFGCCSGDFQYNMLSHQPAPRQVSSSLVMAETTLPVSD